MRQLSGLDTMFLAMETPSTVGHVAHLVICDSAGDDAGSFAKLRDLVGSRLHLFPAYRQRVIEVPLGLDHPYWADDPDFDLDFHLRETSLPTPGNDDQLSELVARIMSRPLDRRRPLWEMYHISGLEGGRFAWLNKVHHSAMDGQAGARLLVSLLEPEPSTDSARDEPQAWTPHALPGTVKLTWLAARGLATSPLRTGRLAVRTASTAGRVGRLGELPFGWGKLPWSSVLHVGPAAAPGPPLIAPRVSFNAPITPHRRYGFTALRLSDAKTVKRHYDTTLNDVVLAVCTGALRNYLQRRDELPDKPLVALVPVSVRDPKDGSIGGNHISGLWAPLPVQVEDPVERLRLISGAMAASKNVDKAIGADLLQNFTQFATPIISANAARLASRTKMANRGRPIYNIVVSNVPGPSSPLYLAGSRMLHWFPVSLVNDSAGLNITVHSYEDSLDFGVLACRDLVPDVTEMLWDLGTGLQELLALTQA